ncbi:MAG: hypothetical protein QM767_25500 [Anaeromyxobacter sp.]
MSTQARGVRAAGARAGRAVQVALAMLLLATLGVFHVWTRTQVVTAGYALGELTREHDELVARNEQLKLELAMLRSPGKLNQALLRKLAKLGMAPPDRGAVVAAGPGRPMDGTGRAGVDGVGDRSRPAGPALPSSLALSAGGTAPQGN